MELWCRECGIRRLVDNRCEFCGVGGTVLVEIKVIEVWCQWREELMERGVF